jgi:phosphotransferase system HPr (HPr) family protein
MSASSDLVVEGVVVLPADLHARPAGQVTTLAAAFDATVEVVVGDRTVPANSVLAVMGLGARAGQELTVRATGAQASEAVAAVTAARSVADPAEGDR